VTLPLPAALRDRVCRWIARRRAARVGRDYEQIGGASPLNRHSREQARALEQRLADRFGAVTGATFKVYVSTRYGTPSASDVQAQMDEDGIAKVVLLPLHPHYARCTTGSSLAQWRAYEERSGRAASPTALVYEYATHPKYVQALSERIDEGLQRFPVTVRDRVHLVFSGHGAPRKDMTRRGDPYCCLVHSTVQQVMAHREGHDAGRAFHVAFQSKVGPAKGLTPSTPDKLEQLADDGHTAVLVVPVAFVSDHVETAYALDIEVREEALRNGIEHYEVTSGLNCHPLLIEALAECVAAQVSPVSVSRGDGADALPAALPALPRY